MRSVKERFWAKVEKGEPSECWLWNAGLQTAGYGWFWHDGRNVFAHRFAYELLVGPIPTGLQLDHLCRVRKCVNPTHLEPVSGRVNVLRGVGASALNASKTQCPQGHVYDEANTLIIKGKRNCRDCRRQRNIEYRARRGTVRLTAEQRARKTELQRQRRIGGAA